MSLAGVNCCSVKQQTTQDRKVNMPKTKKKNIKVRDLKPKKDAKGGMHYLGAQTASHAASQTSANLASSRNITRN